MVARPGDMAWVVVGRDVGARGLQGVAVADSSVADAETPRLEVEPLRGHAGRAVRQDEYLAPAGVDERQRSWRTGDERVERGDAR